jgi:tetratricopeptide (TPR) repeat protein
LFILVKTSLLIDNQFLKRGAFSLHELLAIQPLPNQAKLLIVCDQFEEIFRYYEQGSQSEAQAFIALLLASSQSYYLPDKTLSHDVYVILTMRSDFLGECALFSGLTEAINKGLYLTPRLNREQLRLAIEEPALIFDGEVEPQLTVKLLNDAGNNSDQLPLLQHILMRLWQLSLDKQLTLTDYENIGGFERVLSNHADEILNSLTPNQQSIAELLFRNLCERQSEKRDTRRPVKFGQILELIEPNQQDDLIVVIKRFQQDDCHFLISDEHLKEDSIIDIAHESLIRQWQTLQEWTNKESESAKTYLRLIDRAIEWQKRKANLLQQPELGVFLHWKKEMKPNASWAKRYGDNFQQADLFLSKSEKANRYRIIALRIIVVMIAAAALNYLEEESLKELQTTNKELQKTNDELKTTNDELKTTNEQEIKQKKDSYMFLAQADNLLNKVQEKISNSDLDKAIKLYLKSSDVDEKNNLAWFGLGNAYRLKAMKYSKESPKEANKFYQEAINSYKKVIKLDENSKWTWYYLGGIYQNLGEIDNAIQNYRTQIKVNAKLPRDDDKDKSSSLSWYYIGTIHERQNKLIEAKSDYMNAVKIKTNINVENELSRVKKKLKEK